MTAMYMALAVAFEVGWALAMKASKGLTHPGYAAATIVMYLLSVVFLALACRKMDVGVAYAIWAGSGVAIIAVGGAYLFHEPLTVWRVAAIGLIIAGIVCLSLTGTSHAPLAP